jgi:hypothetical protein
VVPHIIFRSPLLRLADFVLNDAKDFCNTIGTFRTSQPSCVMSAVEVRADEGRGRFDISF